MKKLVLLTFPYKTDAQGNSFPVIPLSLMFGNKKKEFFALVDSGATISIFRSEVADSLGINVTSGKEIYLGGVGDPTPYDKLQKQYYWISKDICAFPPLLLDNISTTIGP